MMKKILNNSLVYAGSGLDFNPVRWANYRKLVSNYIYIDLHTNKQELMEAADKIESYSISSVVDLNLPSFFRTSNEQTGVYEGEKYKGWFMRNILFARKEGHENAGLPEFRLLYIHADAAVAYYSLYYKYETSCKYLCVTRSPLDDEDC
jgi:hypothetical protein